KDEAVVAADLVDVNDRDVVFARDGLQHVVPQRTLVERVGGGGDIQQQGTSLPDDLGDRIAVVESLRPEALIVPTILADRDPQVFGLEWEYELVVRGLEVAGL